LSFVMRLPNAEYLTDLMRAISAVVDEATFKIDSEGLKLVSMDPAHISLVDFLLSKEAAEEYSVAKELELTVNMQDLLKFLKRAKKGESLTLSYDAEKKKLMMTLSDSAYSRERSFQLSTLEPAGMAAMSSPKLSFEAKARLSTDALWEAIEDAGIIADAMKITIQPEMIILTARGETSTVQNKLSKQGALVFEIQTDKEVSASFSLTYLEKIVKPCRDISEEVTMMLSTNKPIKLHFPFPAGRLEYLIAPRLE